MFMRRGRLLPSTQRALIVLPLWTACLIWMWVWWFHGTEIVTPWLYVPLSIALFYEFALLPSIFLYFLFRIKFPAVKRAPKGKKVAVISLCVPSSESLAIVERQLKAMAAIKYPHDSWILDEGNNKDIKMLAKRYGVKHFSRNGIARYNSPLAPFKAKTKAGNVNAWLEHTKRFGYEFFVQFDIDHLAKPEYLNKTLGYFKDPLVAWVQAPSVYGNHEHWTARGSSEQELVLQGPLQMGFYGHSETPFIIGSHCTYRTRTIREIGGFQPTRAEDHLDTVMLANKGYKGVFLPEVIAVGDGPEDLSTYLGQQFAWAYSMFQVLTQHSPKLLRAMPWRKRFQFLFSQTWYPLWSLSYFVTFIVPVISLLIDREVTHIRGISFITHFLPLFACSFLVWWCARPVMQPAGLGLTWRGMLLHVVRWPIVLIAVVSAAFHISKPYMITPKGILSDTPPLVSVYRPFILLGLTGSLSVLIASELYGNHIIASQIFFALLNALFMLLVCTIDLNIRLRRSAIRVLQTSTAWLKPVGATALLAILLSSSFIVSPPIINRSTKVFGPHDIQLSSLKTTVPLQQQSQADILAMISQLPTNDAPTPSLGLYNVNKFVRSNSPIIRHNFIDWRDSKGLATQIFVSERANDVPLITLEPRGDNNGPNLLTAIASGHYDARLHGLASVVKSSNQPVYIRFAHEMELADLYPWSGQDPSLYIAAYRHVVELFRNDGAQQARWVWSPAGNVGAGDYYPGDDVVDVVGVTMLYDVYFYPDYKPNFDDIASGRAFLQNIGKPVWITEFGAGKHDPAFQREITTQALNNFQADGYQALVYLNTADSNIVGPDYRLPNFDVFGDLFQRPLPSVEATAKIPTIKHTSSLKPPSSKQKEIDVIKVLTGKSSNFPSKYMR